MTEAADIASRLRTEAETDPERVDLDAVYDLLTGHPLTPTAHANALVALLHAARATEPGERFVEPLVAALHRPALDADALVLRCLRAVASNDPEAVLALRDEIIERISSRSTDVTQAATGCCVELAAAEPAAFVDLVPMLATHLDADAGRIRQHAVYILSRVAHEYPEEVKPVVPELIDGIDARDHTYQTNALSALGAIASSYPAAAAQATDALAELAASDAPTKVRANAVALLSDVAVAYPAEIEDHVPVLVACLHSDDEFLAGNAASAILHVVVDEGEGVEEAIPALVELLDDPSPVVRRNACKALGHLEATVAREHLTSVAEDDPDETVRSVAAWAVEHLA